VRPFPYASHRSPANHRVDGNLDPAYRLRLRGSKWRQRTGDTDAEHLAVADHLAVAGSDAVADSNALSVTKALTNVLSIAGGCGIRGHDH
jgi:hypothetical protein